MANKQKRGLGLGMSALFGEEETEVFEPETESAKKETEMLPISRVEPRAAQPRKEFDPEKLEELADSIREYGMIQPITVRSMDRGYYQIIAGERRWRAARMAGLKEVPVRIVECDDRLASEMALVENLQRDDLKPLEEARGYRTLMEQYALTQEEVSLRVQKSRSAVANSLRLLSLGEEALKLVENGSLSAGHARALLGLTEPEKQAAAARKVAAEGLSVRQTEALVQKLRTEPKAKPEQTGDGVDYRREAEHRLTESLGREVKISGGNKGRITLSFYSADDREALMEALRTLEKRR
ncbi:MAG: ParB/RepB/Spo0J family partition protein [Oscillospiraceae bacterium]|nr:ParB/RepB/Spo0J family partition protein [Oscillospiraceae bacterium]